MSKTPLHSNFFSSLKQVEKRLKLESPGNMSAPSSPKEPLEQAMSPSLQTEHGGLNPTESLSSPIHLYGDHQTNQSSMLQESEPPPQFLSYASGPLWTNDDPHLETHLSSAKAVDDRNEDNIDDILLLINILGLTDQDPNKHVIVKNAKIDLKSNDDVSDKCHCHGGFYEEIAGIKGPKCGKEVQRLDGWIRNYSSMNGEEKKEPLRLAHLLLGKASYLLREESGSEALEFPSTVHEFLLYDPPPE